MQSRYYDPNTCRFINADSYVSTGQGILGHNMFAYCNNNPVMYVDPTGEVACTMVSLDHEVLGDGSSDWQPFKRYRTTSGTVVIYDGTRVDYETYRNIVEAITYSGFIYVYDARNGENPNMQIFNSYLIENKNEQRVILEVLCKHDSLYPSARPWGRTVDSMLIEWDAHNKLYFISRHERVAHTDFDFKDENTTYPQYWARAIREGLGI